MGKYTPESYFLNPAHKAIAESRYFRKDDTGKPIETDIFQVFHRVNSFLFDDDEKLRQEMQRLCEEKKFMYAGRPLAQAGTNITNLLNCFVLGIDDSREAISETQRIHFHVQAHGGGTGINFSSLRPSGSWCKGANSRSSGPEGFITAMGYLSSNIQQGGNRCLPWTARVQMADGSWKALNEVHSGELVVAIDPVTLTLGKASVLEVYDNGVSSVFAYTLSSGKRLVSTPNHKWMVKTDQGYEVRPLKKGDLVYILEHGKLETQEVVEFQALDAEPVGCLRIDSPYHLFVADGAISHNSGANMGILEDWHPGLLNFISKKSRSNWENLRRFAVVVDEGKFKQWQWEHPYPWQTFNVSVALSDKFMRQVKRKSKAPWKLHWKGVEWGLWDFEITLHDYLPNGEDLNTTETITVVAPDEEIAFHEALNKVPFRNKQDLKLIRGPYHLTAYEWFYRICQNAWEDGCPGIFFIDRARAFHNGEYCHPLSATNPCVTADTLVQTANGLRFVKELIGAPFDAVVNGKVYRSPSGFFHTGYREVGLLTTQEGYELALTPDHRVLRSDGKWVEAANLRPGDKIVVNNVGDLFQKEKLDLDEFEIGRALGIEFEEGISASPERGIYPGATLNPTFLTQNRSFKRGFLGGWFDRVAAVVRMDDQKAAIRLRSTSRPNLQIAQQALLELGIPSRVHETEDAVSNELIIEEALPVFQELIGFTNQEKMHILYEALEASGAHSEPASFVATVASYEVTDQEEVFDCVVDEVHRFSANGLVVHNCGEQILPEWSVCCLSNLILPDFVLEDGSIDWDDLRTATHMGIRALTRIVQKTRTGVDVIDKRSQEERRVGLGTIGIHELLIRVALRTGKDIRYSNAAGRALATKILKFIKHEAYEASIELAKEIGPFPAYDYDGIMRSKFMQKLVKERPDIHEKIKKYGLANVTLLTQPPTGTSGTITGYSSGCEPYFAMAYLRNSNVGTILDGCPSFLQWLEERGIDYADYGYDLTTLRKKKRVPKVFEEAHDIPKKAHLAMQAVFSEQVDSSVSKCLAEGTLLNTNRGLLPIEQCGNARGEDVFGEPIEGLTVIDENGNHRKVLAHYSAGKKEATRVTLRNGASICGATLSHRVKTTRGWKTLGELRQDDLVLVNDRFEASYHTGGSPIDVNVYNHKITGSITLPDKMSSSLALLLGMLAAVGEIDKLTGRISFYDHADLGEYYTSLVEDRFGVHPEVYTDGDTAVAEYRIVSDSLAHYLCDLIGDGPQTRRIPEQILTGSHAEKQHFIEGLTLAGTLLANKGLVVYEGPSEQFAYQVAEVLRSFGLPRVYCGKRNQASHDQQLHRVIISDELQKVLVPLEADKWVKPASTRYGSLVAFDLAVLDALQLSPSDPYYHAVLRLQRRKRNYCSEALARALGLPILGRVEKIASIEHLGKINMYDIEVEESHNYLVSGIVSHNTLNLPSSATVEDIIDIYIKAYDLGIKSTTVYRDGSKTQILEHLNKAKKQGELRPNKIITFSAPKRPEVLECDIHTVSIQGEKWKVLIGLLHGQPYETFCFPETQIQLPASCTQGKLVRRGRGKYRLSVAYGEEELVINDVASLLLTDEHRMITRLLSTSLRHGSPLPAIVAQLAKCDGDVTAFSRALSRVLKRYISEEEHIQFIGCPQCRSRNLVSEDGCYKCLDCGFSGCE